MYFFLLLHYNLLPRRSAVDFGKRRGKEAYSYVFGSFERAQYIALE
jgi:hypothetical protein